jgi:hypothetical protein
MITQLFIIEKISQFYGIIIIGVLRQYSIKTKTNENYFFFTLVPEIPNIYLIPNDGCMKNGLHSLLYGIPLPQSLDYGSNKAF